MPFDQNDYNYYHLFSQLFVFFVNPRTCPVVTMVVSMARAVRKAIRESYVDRCGPLGVQLCTKYRLAVFLSYVLCVELLSVKRR